MSAPTPVAGSQGVPLGLGSKGSAVVGCGGLGISCHPPTFAERAECELSFETSSTESHLIQVR